MRKTVFGTISTFFVALSLGSLQVGTAIAIESAGVGALPAHPRVDNPRTKSIFVYDIRANDIVTDGIKVINNTESTKTLAVYPVDSQTSSDGAFACAQKVDPRKEVGNWIKLQAEQVTVAANSSQTIPFTLTIPQTVNAGEHNGCIVVQNVEQPTKKNDGVALSFRSALRVALTTPGSLQANLQLIDVQSRSISQKTLGVSPILKNTGNVSADTHISVKLAGVFGFRYPFSATAGQFPVFPGVQTRFNFELEKPFWGGWYNRDVEVGYRKQLASGQLSDDVSNIKASRIVFIGPQPVALLIESIIALIVAGLIFYIVRRYRLHPYSRSTNDYVVQEGDTIESVAKHFNITAQELVKLNALQPPYALKKGQVITVTIHLKRPPGHSPDKQL